MEEDTALTTPGVTHCPTCDQAMPADASPMLPGGWSIRRWHCLTCGQTWNEERDVVTTTRYWTRVRVPACGRPRE